MERITIATVNYASADWIRLQIASLKRHTKHPYRHIVIDNDGSFPETDGVDVARQSSNIGHGAALDIAKEMADTRILMVLDADAHVLMDGWDRRMLEHMEEDVFCLGAHASHLKPFHPCAMMVNLDLFKNGRHSFQKADVSGLGGHFQLDVGVFATLRAMHDGLRCIPLPRISSPYKDVHGDAFGLDGNPLVFHHWYGSRFAEAGCDTIDGIKKSTMDTSKQRLFAQVPYAF